MVLYQLVFLLSVGIWWIGFAQITFITFQYFSQGIGERLYLKGLRELKVVLNNLKYFKSLKQFLIAFFFIALEFKLLLAGLLEKNCIDTSKLIIIILLINVVAILERICFRDYQRKLVISIR
jgi:UMF1 family MFS transporter